MSLPANPTARQERLWYPLLAVLFLFALWLRWPHPDPEWTHIDEWVFLLNPLKLWSGDLNPHFYNYPTLHIYLCSALYYLYYALWHAEPLGEFVAYRFFIDGSDLIAIARGFNTVLSALTALVVAGIGRRLYGVFGGLLAALFFSVLPLSVRFAHLASTDSAAVLWIALALLGGVQIVQRGRVQDYMLAGICAGLAGATKYPAAIVCAPLALACLLRIPTLRQQGIWLVAGLAAATFALASPYVLLDAESAWEDFARMGQFHLLSQEGATDIPSWWYYLRYLLPHGIGSVGLLATVVGLVWRRKNREEWVIIAAVGVFMALLMAAESVFMRYALPLAPLLVLLWTRLVYAWRGWLLAIAVLALIAEPLYASLQTRRLLSGEDTREQVKDWLHEHAAKGAWLVHLPPFIGNVRVVDPGKVFSHERRFLFSYSRRELIDAYGMLSQRSDLPPLYLSFKPELVQTELAVEGSAEGDKAYVLWYQHPVIPAVEDADSRLLLQQCAWLEEYGTGGSGATYEAVDWFFAPIGQFADVERTGPNIRVGQVALKANAASMASEQFFAVLHGILLGTQRLEAGDWHGVVDIYRDIMQVPLPLEYLLSGDYLYTYLFNLGVAFEKLGYLQQATSMWEEALLVKDDKPELLQNLGVAYAHQGQFALARKHLQQALVLDKSYAAAHFNLGNLLYQDGDMAGAEAAFASAIDADSSQAGAWQGLGNVLFARRDWPGALAAYRQALGYDPALVGVAFNMAKVHMQTSPPDSAIAALRLAVASEPEDAESLYLMGDIYRGQGEFQAAQISYNRALELAPEAPQAGAIRRYLEQGIEH